MKKLLALLIFCLRAILLDFPLALQMTATIER